MTSADELSRALFATQSATRIDLVAPSAPRYSVIDDPLYRKYGTGHRRSPAPPGATGRPVPGGPGRPGSASPPSEHSPGWSARLASSWRWACAGRLCARCGDGGEQHDARLGRAVVGLADGAEQAGARGRVDDPSPAPRAPLSALRVPSDLKTLAMTGHARTYWRAVQAPQGNHPAGGDSDGRAGLCLTNQAKMLTIESSR